MFCLNNTHELFLKEESDIQTMEQNKYNLSTLTLLSDSISYAISVIRLGLKDMRKKRNTWNRSETFWTTVSLAEQHGMSPGITTVPDEAPGEGTKDTDTSTLRRNK